MNSKKRSFHIPQVTAKPAVFRKRHDLSVLCFTRKNMLPHAWTQKRGPFTYHRLLQHLPSLENVTICQSSASREKTYCHMHELKKEVFSNNVIRTRTAFRVFATVWVRACVRAFATVWVRVRVWCSVLIVVKNLVIKMYWISGTAPTTKVTPMWRLLNLPWSHHLTARYCPVRRSLVCWWRPWPFVESEVKWVRYR